MAGINSGSEDNIQQKLLNSEIDVFTEAESSLNIKIPIALKSLLIANGFENEIIISNINDSDITDMVSFARNDLHKIIDKEDLPKYYGLYWKNPSLFEIVPGFKRIIALLSEYYKKKLSHKDTVRKMTTNCKNKRSQILQQLNSNQASTSSSINEEIMNNNSSTSEESFKSIILEENIRIQKTITSWAQGKVTKDEWETLREPFNNIIIRTSLDAGKLTCVITCFCGANYNIFQFSKRGSKSKRWIYSNFQKHLLKKHIQNTNSSATKFVNEKSRITHYISKAPEFSNAKIGHNIEFANTENIEKASQNNKVNNKEDTLEVMNVMEVIDQAEIIFDTVNVIDIVEDIVEENRIIDSQKINEEYDNDCSISNSSYVVDPNIDSSTHTYPTSKVNASQCDKWKSMKYQRSERLKRAREKLSPNQNLITDYFILAEKISKIICHNSEVTENLLPKIKNSEIDSAIKDNELVINNFLKKLLDISLKNSASSNRNSYDEATKKFSIYLYYVGGKLLYETLHANLPNVLPSISTLNRYDKCQYTEEGKIDFNGLVQHLKERNASKVIWIAEDATRITGKIEYDSRSNKVFGFVLPLKNGLPDQKKYVATSAEAIQNFFKIGTKATYAYVIMAQSLSCNVPAYCLSLFSTDNKFNAKDILERWTFIKKEAKKFDITIAGFSSDGDTRLLKGMRLNNSLPIISNQIFPWSNTWPWFQIDMNKVEECYVQDTTHIITKMRTRFLKEEIILQMGNYLATVDHLHYLVKNVSKDKHLLTSLDLKGEDKMNYSAGEKMCSSRVISQLKQIANTDGTIAYLNIMNYIILSFLNDSTSLNDRVYYMWYSVFFLRIWRAWIKKNKQYTIKDNFLTNNCYLCIELNAHNLIKLITLFKNNKQIFTPEMFRPTIFSSQMCEKLFRIARSMTSTYSTVINFSIKDLINRIDRIKQINSIMNDLSGIFIFPREDKKKLETLNVLTYEDIENLNIKAIVEKALKNVIESTEKLGMKITSDTYWKFVDIILRDLDNDCKFDDIECDIDNDCTINSKNTNVEDVDICASSSILFDDSDFKLESLELKDFSKQISRKSITENSPFVEIKVNDKIMIVKKSSYCWLLDECKGKISTDRLRRFITLNNTNKRKNCTKVQLEKKQKYLQISNSFKEDQICNEECFLENDPNMKVPEILLEKYYAVFYDDSYYIGRVVEQCKNQVKMKFLKSELDCFIWPRDEDVTFVETKYIFHGPIELIGTGPFILKHFDLEVINKKYKLRKRNKL